uniref:C2H2-type domain-containing protein n=1 Tax=Meloidogyne hapla TaxID=6305 RepID=A0A1I8B482_MELHA
MASIKMKCPHCPAKIDSRRYQEHLILCEITKPFPCNICGKRFQTQLGLTVHESKYHTADERGTEFKCRYCEQGSNSRKDMDKHESIHEEAGGTGFRSRSRSRSRGPVENRSETSVLSPVTSIRNASNNNSFSHDLYTTQSDETVPHYAISQSQSLHVERSRSRPAVATHSSQVRAKSKQAVFVDTPSTSQNRSVSRPSVVNPSNNFQGSASQQKLWAHIPPTVDNLALLSSFNSIHTNQQDELNVSSTTTDGSPEQNGIEQSNINAFTILDKNAILRRIAEQNKEFANTLKLYRKQNNFLRNFCLKNPERFPLYDRDPVEEKIREFERIYGDLPESDDENSCHD